MQAGLNNPELVEVWRGPAVESFHRGALAIVDAQGHVYSALGDIDRPVFPRSAVKLLQALPLVASGAADALGLSDAELALACASHGGDPEHVQTAAAMLAKAGLDRSALECGTHWPLLDVAARELAAAGQVPHALHNNCSGKHAGFVCLGRQLCGLRGDRLAGWLAGYVEPEHPVMRTVGAALQAATGADLAQAPRGIDGCSIPTWALPLRALARGFARAATGEGLPVDLALAARRLRAAIARAPQMVAGRGRFDTRLMQRLGERVCCKVGAEGVYAAALPELGLGVALKIDDGQGARAAEVVMATVVAALLRLDDGEQALLAELAEPRLVNWNARQVGRLAPTAGLRAALTPRGR
ncbi:MAG: asparaginase [Burkholderiaceae bacterium]|nr:asparaginase [Burkholderiaceae bacterium]